jgi:hypothetical protein
MNGWSYVEGNPITGIDPSGACSVGNPAAPPVDPTPEQAQELIPSLDRIWWTLNEDYKPKCCRVVNECAKNCATESQPRRPVVLPANHMRFAGDPDGFMRYWLAWEKANPCCYRDEANCMGTALEVSYLYSKSSFVKRALNTPRYFNTANGYGDVQSWRDLRPEAFYYILGVALMPGDMLVQSAKPYMDPLLRAQGRDDVVSSIPKHFMAATDHFQDGLRLCFEKGGTEHPYQLRPCSWIVAGSIFYIEYQLPIVGWNISYDTCDEVAVRPQREDAALPPNSMINTGTINSTLQIHTNDIH